MSQHSLIDTLRELYRRLAMRLLEARKNWRSRRHDKDIASPLHKYIDRIADEARPDPGADSGQRLTDNCGPVEGQPSERKESPITPQATGLHQYFQDRKAATALSTELGDKLKNSAWHHLHEAIRLGRLGDKDNARMHVDLADHTLKEAVQFMRRDDFEELLDQIQAKLDEALGELEH